MDDDEHAVDGLPSLGRGAHRDVHDGACVMEYAALLSGDRHGDRPRAVDPLLVTFCVWTNDTVEAEARSDLLRLVPALIGTSGPSTSESDDDVLRAVARVLGVEEVDGLLDDGGAREPVAALPERTDPGTGGGTAVLDRPAGEGHRAGPGYRTASRDAASIGAHRLVTHRFVRLLTGRASDQQIVDTLEVLVHTVRAARGLPPVATFRDDRRP